MKFHSAAVQYLCKQLILETSDWGLPIKDLADTISELWACPECATPACTQRYSYWQSQVSTAHTATWNMIQYHSTALSRQKFTKGFHIILRLCLRKFELRINRRRLSFRRNTTTYFLLFIKTKLHVSVDKRKSSGYRHKISKSSNI
jgi:hypothetical protein